MELDKSHLSQTFIINIGQPGLGPKTGKDARQSLETIRLIWKPHDVDTKAQTEAGEAIPDPAQASLPDHLSSGASLSRTGA